MQDRTIRRYTIDEIRLFKLSASRRRRLIELFGGECSRCQYSEFAGALEFHHIGPTQKSFALSGNALATHSWKEVQFEAEKCLLLCCNCHRLLHFNLKNTEHDKSS